jgi:hypothetical protein
MVFGFLDVWGRLPVNFFLKDDLHWSPSQVSWRNSFAILPTTCKCWRSAGFLKAGILMHVSPTCKYMAMADIS